MAFLVSPLLPISAVGSVIALGSWIAVWTKQSGWKSDLKQFAQANGFELLKKELPDGFIFRGTSLHDPEVDHVMKGSLHGVDMVVFLASFLTKDGNTTHIRAQTVVAFPNSERLGSRQIPPTGDPNFYMEVAGDWLVLYHRALVVKKDQLQGWCEKMYAVTQAVVAGMKAKG